jgi:signal transduction histidine kinase
MLRGEFVAIEDLILDDRFRHDGHVVSSVRGLLVVPVGRQKPLGAIGAYWTVPRRTTARELALLQGLADSVALALERAQSFASVEGARAQAEATATVHQQLLAVVSHDLRNPLNVIANSAEILGGMAIEDVAVAGHVQRHVSTIRRVSSRMEKLIQDLLDLAQLRAGALELRREQLDVRSLFEMVEDYRPLVLQKGQHLHLDLPPERHAVYADRERIGQVLANLVGNAVKFTPPAGTIVVSAVWGKAPNEGEVTICVRDSGPGIATSDVERLFGQFTRGAAHDGSGSGLGLWIAKGLVEVHGGRIWAENHDRGGAAFSFTIPSTSRPDGSGAHSQPFVPATLSVASATDEGMADDD